MEAGPHDADLLGNALLRPGEFARHRHQQRVVFRVLEVVLVYHWRGILVSVESQGLLFDVRDFELPLLARQGLCLAVEDHIRLCLLLVLEAGLRYLLTLLLDKPAELLISDTHHDEVAAVSDVPRRLVAGGLASVHARRLLGGGVGWPLPGQIFVGELVGLF